jgi:hypothetical protein
MEKRVRLNTAVVVRSRDANTVLAINAAFVDNEDGNAGARNEAFECGRVVSGGVGLDVSDAEADG